MGDPYVTAIHPAQNSVCCYTLGEKPPCPKKKRKVHRRQGTRKHIATPVFTLFLLSLSLSHDNNDH